MKKIQNLILFTNIGLIEYLTQATCWSCILGKGNIFRIDDSGGVMMKTMEPTLRLDHIIILLFSLFYLNFTLFIFIFFFLSFYYKRLSP